MTTLQLVTRIPITMPAYCRRQQIMYILSILELAELCPHYFRVPIDPRDITVVASALRCPWRSTLTIVRSLVVFRRLRGAQ